MKLSKRNLVRSFPKRKEIAKSYKDLERELSRLRKKLEIEREFLTDLNKVTEIIDGEPICIWGTETHPHYQSVDPENQRIAHIYLNAHNKKTFGLRIQEYWAKGNDHRWYGDQFCGSGWESKAEVEKAALDWVIHAKLPMMDGKGKVVLA
jgi:hypothetical protein